MAGVGELSKMGSSLKNVLEEVGSVVEEGQKVVHSRHFWVPSKFITRTDGIEQVRCVCLSEDGRACVYARTEGARAACALRVDRVHPP